jgi:quercetin dioxygenase-like cupin family protein
MWDRARRHDRRDALFGGRGAVRVWDAGSAGLPRPFAVALACELEPGASVGAHVQEHHPEVVIGVEGRGVARVDGAPHALEPGAVVPVALGRRLAIENGSEAEPLRYLILKAVSFQPT